MHKVVRPKEAEAAQWLLCGLPWAHRTVRLPRRDEPEWLRLKHTLKFLSLGFGTPSAFVGPGVQVSVSLTGIHKHAITNCSRTIQNTEPERASF